MSKISKKEKFWELLKSEGSKYHYCFTIFNQYGEEFIVYSYGYNALQITGDELDWELNYGWDRGARVHVSDNFLNDFILSVEEEIALLIELLKYMNRR